MKSVDSQIYDNCISKVLSELKDQVNAEVDRLVRKDVEQIVGYTIFEFHGKMFDRLVDEIYD